MTRIDLMQRNRAMAASTFDTVKATIINVDEKFQGGLVSTSLEKPTYTGCPKKNETGFLLNISATNDRILKLFSSPKNWDPYAHFEYRTIFVRFLGAEIFAKQNGILD